MIDVRVFAIVIVLLFVAGSEQLKGQLLISEIMAVNSSGEINPVSGEPDDWMEIFNGTDKTLDLSSYFLSDDPDNPLKWKFPAGAFLPPGEYHLIWADGTDHSATESHANFRLGVSGETLSLHSASGVLVDSITFPAMHEDISFGVSADGSRVFFKQATPGSTNDGGSGFLFSGKVSMDPPSAIYNQAMEVALLPESSGTMRYTLDGSTPDIMDPVYSTPLKLPGNSVIRARLWQEGFEPGPVATSSFLLNEGFNFPVVSLSTDPEHFFDDSTGIYVQGTNGIPGFCVDIPANWNQEWERPLSFEYFDLTGDRQFQYDGGTKIHGGCSRAEPMKSLAFFTRSKYGSSQIDYPFFSMKEVDSFKGLILRNWGNDLYYTMFRDAMMQGIVANRMNLDYQAYQAVQLFLNGEFWGTYNLREKVNEHWITSNYNISADEIDFIEGTDGVFTGSREGFDSLYSFLEQNSLVTDENYQWVAEQMDLDSYIDYMITHMFFANQDWPGNNLKYWRERTPGSKWRWILFDMDQAMSIYKFNPSLNMFTYTTSVDPEITWPNPAWSTLIIRRLFENEAFRDEFIRTYLIHMNTTLRQERILQFIDTFHDMLYEHIPPMIERWERPRSMDFWERRINKMREYASMRHGYVNRNMRNFFGLREAIYFQIEPSEGNCVVMANNIPIPEEGTRGEYMAGIGLDLDCRVSPGYRFSHWEVISTHTEGEVLLPAGADWRYYDMSSDPGPNWQWASYDDSAWKIGPGILGYGDNGESTILDFGGDPQNKRSATYFRSFITIENRDQYQWIKVKVLRDDGIFIYLNGHELIRDNMPGGLIRPSSLAVEEIEGDDDNTYQEFLLDPQVFNEGVNFLAVEIHKFNVGSANLGFDMEVIGTAIMPGDTAVYGATSLSLKPEEGIIVKAIIEKVEENLIEDLYINEFMASNKGAVLTLTGEDVDWLEIYNAGEKEVDLSGYYLTDDRDDPAKWQIPENESELTTIGAGDYILFSADGDPDKGPLHTSFKLSAKGEFIGLSTLSGSIVNWIDSLSFGGQSTNISLGRYPDGSSNWVTMGIYTPGSSNEETNIPPAALNTRFDIFPNPFTDRLNFRLIDHTGDNTKELTLYLFDITGRKVYEHIVTGWGGDYSGSMDIPNLQEGIYFLVLESGNTRFSRKVIKSYP